MAQGKKKSRFSFLNSFKFCRPKNPSSLVQSPLPKDHSDLFSPLNSKSFEISFPSFPDPPPTTPAYSSPKRDFTQSKSSKMHSAKDNRRIFYSSPILSESDERGVDSGKAKIERKKSKASVTTSISSRDSDETDSLFSSPPSFTSSHDKLKAIIEEPMKRKIACTRSFRRFGSKEWKDGLLTEAEGEFLGKKPVSGKLVDGIVNESFVVVKRSVDPYEDFKNSMLEMILEKQIFEPKEMEQLLMSFLSLNSKLHHKAIVEAFTEIWKEVFSASSV